MAASTLPSPGTKFGPCDDGCSHRDCAELRRMAEAICPYCKLSIGWGRRFYNGAALSAFLDWPEAGQLMHANCLEDSLERR